MKDFLRNVRMREFEFHEWLDHKLEQVRLEEREACAKVCETDIEEGESPWIACDYAAAIRARGEK